MENRNEAFNYTYSAKQQEEVNNIRQRYIPREENKMDLLRSLDEKTRKPGTIASIVLGTVSSLILGVGMCCTMVWPKFFVLGIIVGIIGIAGVALAYPLYISVTKKQKEKLGPQILKLSNELMQR